MSTDRGGVPWPWDSKTDASGWKAERAPKASCGECVFRMMSHRGKAMCAYILLNEDRVHVPGADDIACGAFRIE